MAEPNNDDDTTAPGDNKNEPEPFDEERAKAKIRKANSEAEQLRKRLKDAEAKAAKYDELEDANKSEQQKLADKVAEAERKAQEAEARALRFEVAHERGLTAAQAKRLVGTTREELDADATELLDSFKAPEADGDKGGAGPARKPTENLRGGGAPNEEPEETDPLKLAAQVPRG